MARAPVLILDFGSQYTQLIARRIRELRVYCEIHPCTMSVSAIEALKPPAIILSGGPASVFEDGAPTVDPKVFELGVPVLGICYGMQLISHLLGGKVEAASEREYGHARVKLEKAVGLFRGFDTGDEVDVWMSHGDRVAALPPGFEVIGSSKNSPFAAVAHVERQIFGVQFHPEVAHTPRGIEMLSAFLFQHAGVVADWTPGSFVEQTIAAIREQVGSSRAICGLSGGVDSSVAAVLVHQAIGDNLTCIFVDNGLLRKDEAKQVVHTFRDHFHLRLIHVDATEEFLTALEGVTDPEQKRKTIGRLFIEIFEREAKKIEDARFLVQGTLYPDVIESVSHKGPSAVIKSHHNVGGLPERMNLALVEPLRLLFKDEVREVGAELGMPHHVLWRQPFPGPGLAVRCPGAKLLRHPPGQDRGRDGRLPHLRVRHRHPRRREPRRNDRRLGAPPLRPPRPRQQPHHQRGQGLQPRLLRHLLEAARDDRVGVNLRPAAAGWFRRQTYLGPRHDR